MAARRRLLLLLVAGLGSSCGGGGGGGSSGDCAAGVFPAGIERGPQLALVGPTTARVLWTTTEPVLGSVEHGPDAGYGVAAVAPAPTTDHDLLLEGLVPGAPRHYRVVLDGVPATGDLVFRAAPEGEGAAVRLAVLGDSGTGSPEQRAIAARLIADAPDAVIHTGDVAYENGTAEEVRCHYFVPYAHLLPVAPVYPTLGNHDQVADGGATLLGALHLPTNPVDGSERFYSFDVGPCHVAVLDTDRPLDPGTAEGDWLDADLAATPARWKLVVLHPPLWSSGRHGSDVPLRDALAPVFEARGVDVVFCGHDHHYERTYPMAGSTPVDAASEPAYGDTAGVVYVVTGGGGADLYETGTSAFTAHAESSHHFVRVDAGPTTLSLAAVRADGTVADEASITKP